MSRAARPIDDIPPLEAGDRLTRAEFERRYAASPIQKAELVDGVVYVASPVSVGHGEPHGLLVLWAGTWCVGTPGARWLDNATLRLDEDNEPQPDVAVLLPGTRARFDDADYLASVPDVVIEVARSSSSYDLHQKKAVYRRHGLAVYIVWQEREKRVRWFELEEGRYVERAPGADGIFRSDRFPGAWLDPEALAERDGARLLATLQRGLAAR